jgi:hypothetical protein
VVHIAAVLRLAVGHCTHKDVDSPLVDLFDIGHAVEKHIDWGGPLFTESSCKELRVRSAYSYHILIPYKKKIYNLFGNHYRWDCSEALSVPDFD